MSSILGANKYQSASQMWKNKTEKVFHGNAYTYVGQLLEPIVVQVTNDILHRNFKLYEVGDQKLFLYEDEIKLGATPDAYDELDLLECKTTKPHMFIKYRGVMPVQYYVQASVQLLLSPDKECVYLSLMSTNLTQETEELKLPVCIYRIDRNKIMSDLIVSELERFWQCLETGKMFRVNSKVKKQVRMLSVIDTRRII